MRRFASHPPLTLAALFSLTALIVTLRAAAPAPILDLPEQLYFKTLGEPVMHVTEYQLGREGMLTRVTHLRGRSEECRRKITPRAWRQFQERVSSLRLAEWKTEYVHPRKVYDGLTWTLRYQAVGADITSTGHEIGPDTADPSKGVGLENPACGAIILLKALEDLFALLDPLK